MATQGDTATGYARSHSTGWTWFAGIMLTMVGVLNLIDGFALLERKEYFAHETIYNNLTFWGWVFLIAGALQLFAGITSIGGRSVGRTIGTVLAGGATVLWFFLIFSAPWAAFIGVTLNLLILYALTVGAADAWD
jgi:ABC-type antimicrobial peptide transport system permease subunit